MDTSYNLRPSTEFDVAWLIASSKTFFETFGAKIRPEFFETPVARTIVQASLAVAGDIFDAPGSCNAVAQRIHHWCREIGNIKPDLADNACFFLETEDGLGINRLATGNELRQSMVLCESNMLVDNVIEEWGKRGDISKYTNLMREVQLIGVRRDVPIYGLDDASLDALLTNESWDRLTTGIPEFDALTNGGLARGANGNIVGRAGQGKSLLMNQLGGTSCLVGHDTCYVSLENQDKETLLRIITPITGMTLDYARAHVTEVREAFKAYRNAHGIGRLMYFTMDVGSTIEDIQNHITRFCEKHKVGLPKTIILDYIDRVGIDETAVAKKGQAKKKGAANDTHAFKEIMQRWADWCRDWNIWGWTATATSKTKSENSKFLTLEDVSESMHKVRIPDLVCTINDDRVIYIPKHRQGKNGVATSKNSYDPNNGLFLPSPYYPRAGKGKAITNDFVGRSAARH